MCFYGGEMLRTYFNNTRDYSRQVDSRFRYQVRPVGTSLTPHPTPNLPLQASLNFPFLRVRVICTLSDFTE